MKVERERERGWGGVGKHRVTLGLNYLVTMNLGGGGQKRKGGVGHKGEY